MSHQHRWAQYYEQSLIGGAFPSGYRCVDCNKWVSQSEVTPNLGGTVLDEKHLLGPHGGRGNMSDGSVYKEQIWRDGKLEIIR